MRTIKTTVELFQVDGAEVTENEAKRYAERLNPNTVARGVTWLWATPGRADEGRWVGLEVDLEVQAA